MLVGDWDQLRGQPRIFKQRMPTGFTVNDELGPVGSRLKRELDIAGTDFSWSKLVVSGSPSSPPSTKLPQGRRPPNRWSRKSGHMAKLSHRPSFRITRWICAPKKKTIAIFSPIKYIVHLYEKLTYLYVFSLLFFQNLSIQNGVPYMLGSLERAHLRLRGPLCLCLLVSWLLS